MAQLLLWKILRHLVRNHETKKTRQKLDIQYTTYELQAFSYQQWLKTMALSPKPWAVKFDHQAETSWNARPCFQRIQQSNSPNVNGNHAKKTQKKQLCPEQKKTRTGHFFRRYDSFRSLKKSKIKQPAVIWVTEKNTLSIEYWLFNGDRLQWLMN